MEKFCYKILLPIDVTTFLLFLVFTQPATVKEIRSSPLNFFLVQVQRQSSTCCRPGDKIFTKKNRNK